VISRASVLLATVLVLPTNATPSPSPRPAAPAQAGAEPSANPAMNLEWSAPAGCPEGHAVQEEVGKLLGDRAPGSPPLDVRAAILPATGGGFSLTLVTHLDGVTGERTLSAPSCASLADAAALTLALILNPDLVPPAPDASPAPPPPPADAQAAARDRWPPPRWRLGALGGIQTGAVQNLSSSFALSFGFGLGGFSLHLMPGLSLPQDVFVDAERKVGGRLWLATVTALGCWGAPIGWLTLRPCLGFEVTRLAGRGLGVLQPRDTAAYWTSGDLAILAGVPLGSGLSLEIGAVGLLPLHHPTVYLDEIGNVSQPAVFGFRALGGLAWQY